MEIDIMKNKSLSSLNAGIFLVEKNLLDSSVHCFYYSCIQIMIYILQKIFGKSETEIENESRDSATGFHNWIINQIFKKYFTKNRERARKFKGNMYYLKTQRVKADYKAYYITKEEVDKIRNISEELIAYLKEDFL